MWPFRRHGVAGPQPARPRRADAPRPPVAWPQLPSMRRTLGRPGLITGTSFAAGLASWQDPSFLLPLDHGLAADGPCGIASGVVVPVDIHPVPWQQPPDELPLARRPATRRPRGPVASIEAGRILPYEFPDGAASTLTRATASGLPTWELATMPATVAAPNHARDPVTEQPPGAQPATAQKVHAQTVNEQTVNEQTVNEQQAIGQPSETAPLLGNVAAQAAEPPPVLPDPSSVLPEPEDVPLDLAPPTASRRLGLGTPISAGPRSAGHSPALGGDAAQRSAAKLPGSTSAMDVSHDHRQAPAVLPIVARGSLQARREPGSSPGHEPLSQVNPPAHHAESAIGEPADRTPEAATEPELTNEPTHLPLLGDRDGIVLPHDVETPVVIEEEQHAGPSRAALTRSKGHVAAAATPIPSDPTSPTAHPAVGQPPPLAIAQVDPQPVDERQPLGPGVSVWPTHLPHEVTDDVPGQLRSDTHASSPLLGGRTSGLPEPANDPATPEIPGSAPAHMQDEPLVLTPSHRSSAASAASAASGASGATGATGATGASGAPSTPERARGVHAPVSTPLLANRPLRRHTQTITEDSIPTQVRDVVARYAGRVPDDVVVHRTADSAAQARALRARAFTRDGEVHLPAEHGAIGSSNADALLAHELVHVAQQRRLGGTLPAEHTAEGQAMEREAREAELAVASASGGASTEPSHQGPAVCTHDNPGSAALATGLASVDSRGGVVFASAANAANESSAPAVQRAPASATSTSAPAPVAAHGDVDDLARRVYERVRVQLKADLRLDRERAGLLTDLPR
jgi:hypothetical protein